MTTNETPYRQQIEAILNLIKDKVTKYDSEMEGAGHDDFIRSEWAAGAMRQLLREAQLISRADGVPVEKDENSDDVSEYGGDEVEFYEDWCAANGIQPKTDGTFAALDGCRLVAKSEVDELRKEVADLKSDLERAGTEWAQIHTALGSPNILPGESIVNRVEELVKVYRAAMAVMPGWKVAFDQIEKLTAFKTYVHQRMDEAGVPVDPDSPHKVAGCRIGGRLDVLIGERDELRKELAEAKSVLTNFSTWSDDQCSWNDAGVRARAIASAFLARHHPPSAVDAQQVNHE